MDIGKLPDRSRHPGWHASGHRMLMEKELKYTLVYFDSTTNKLVRFKKISLSKYEREDGVEKTRHEVRSRYDFIRNDRTKQVWLKTPNGFKVRIVRKKK